MAEYIKRESVLAKIDEFVKQNIAHGFPVDVFDIEMMKKMVEKLPAADVAPVVHGRMKKSGEFTVERYQYKIVEEKCSVCEHYSIRFKHKSESNFCSRCGAKMDKEVNYYD